MMQIKVRLESPVSIESTRSYGTVIYLDFGRGYGPITGAYIFVQ